MDQRMSSKEIRKARSTVASVEGRFASSPRAWSRTDPSAYVLATTGSKSGVTDR